jgi:hypothetical protein
MGTRSTSPSTDGASSPARAGPPVIRSVSLEGELTLIPQTTETHLDCLVLDHYTSRQRNVAVVLASRLGVTSDIFGEHRVGRVRITVELLAPPTIVGRSTILAR